MEIKRDAIGVVDAITAEDIGKFPDTNLAESLQRITGVSIDRQNGEGAQVTVRGFGPGLQPRHAERPHGSDRRSESRTGNRDNFSGGQGRSFDFSNIAAGSGRRASRYSRPARRCCPSGGIGATINVKTRRPLDTPGLAGFGSA